MKDSNKAYIENRERTENELLEALGIELIKIIESETKEDDKED